MNFNQDTEQKFLEQYQPGDYDRPSVTTDILILTLENLKKPSLKVLLVKRGIHPYKDCWALPGGFVGIKESLDDAAKRKLKEETGLDKIYLEQLYTFGEPERDPRMRVITSAYMALLPENTININAGEGTIDARWFYVNLKTTDEKRQLIITEEMTEDVSKTVIVYNISENNIENGVIGSVKVNVAPDNNTDSKLAFDHAEIIYMALNRIAGKCEYVPILFNLMPKTFTIPALQSVYELFLEKRPHNNLFRQKVLKFIEETGSVDKSSFRPAKLYRYKQ